MLFAVVIRPLRSLRSRPIGNLDLFMVTGLVFMMNIVFFRLADRQQQVGAVPFSSLVRAHFFFLHIVVAIFMVVENIFVQ